MVEYLGMGKTLGLQTFPDYLENAPKNRTEPSPETRRAIEKEVSGILGEQEEFVRQLRLSGWKYDYTEACEKLKEANLYEVDHNGERYKYGHGWIFEEVPSDVLDFLESLPETKINPAWV